MFDFGVINRREVSYGRSPEAVRKLVKKHKIGSPTGRADLRPAPDSGGKADTLGRHEKCQLATKRNLDPVSLAFPRTPDMERAAEKICVTFAVIALTACRKWRKLISQD